MEERPALDASALKENVLKSSVACFYEEGFAKARISDICKRANIAVGTFYGQFPGKKEVLDEIFREMGKMVVNLTAKPVKPSSVEGKTRVFLERYFSFVAENIADYQVLREVEFISGDAGRKFYEDWVDSLCGYFSEINPKRREKFVFILIGAATFVAAVRLIWKKETHIPGKDIRDMAKLLVNGIKGDTSPIERKELSRISRLKVRVGLVTKMRRRKAALLSKAESAFGKDGYTAASVSQICRQADIGIGTFYSFFGSKENTFRELTLSLRDELASYAYAYADGAKNRSEIEARSIVAFFRFIEKHPCGYRILREAEFVDIDLARDYYLGLHREYEERIIDLAQPGEFTTNNVNLLALCLMGIGHILGMKYILWERTKVDDRLLFGLLETVLFGAGQE